MEGLSCTGRVFPGVSKTYYNDACEHTEVFCNSWRINPSLSTVPVPKVGLKVPVPIAGSKVPAALNLVCNRAWPVTKRRRCWSVRRASTVPSVPPRPSARDKGSAGPPGAPPAGPPRSGGLFGLLCSPDCSRLFGWRVS